MCAASVWSHSAACCVYMGTIGRVLYVLTNALFYKASFDQEQLICKSRGGARRNNECCMYRLLAIVRVLLLTQELFAILTPYPR